MAKHADQHALAALLDSYKGSYPFGIPKTQLKGAVITAPEYAPVLCVIESSEALEADIEMCRAIVENGLKLSAQKYTVVVLGSCSDEEIAVRYAAAHFVIVVGAAARQILHLPDEGEIATHQKTTVMCRSGAALRGSVELKREFWESIRSAYQCSIS